MADEMNPVTVHEDAKQTKTSPKTKYHFRKFIPIQYPTTCRSTNPALSGLPQMLQKKTKNSCMELYGLINVKCHSINCICNVIESF
jgi:hypothetical protein